MHVITKLYFWVPPFSPHEMTSFMEGPISDKRAAKEQKKVSPWEVFVYTIFEGWATVLHVELHIVMKQMFNVPKSLFAQFEWLIAT